MEKSATIASPAVNRPGAPARARTAQRSARDVVASPEFRALVKRRWSVSLVLLTILFVSYYGYILLIATNKEFVSQKIGESTTLAIPLGVGVIVLAWLLTGFYVAWANKSYDPEVERLKGELRH
jgi:uncharacterized membrane protein (DUF485 family)